jgi:hypothetical protein
MPNRTPPKWARLDAVAARVQFTSDDKAIVPVIFVVFNELLEFIPDEPPWLCAALQTNGRRKAGRVAIGKIKA